MEFYVSRENTDESFQHYGILGMRWGVRRYQNYDGTLTSAGKKHRKELVAVQSNSNMSVRDAKTKQIEQETAGEYSGEQRKENYNEYIHSSPLERLNLPVVKELLDGDEYDRYSDLQERQDTIETEDFNNKDSDLYKAAHNVAEDYKNAFIAEHEEFNELAQHVYDYYNNLRGIDAYNAALRECYNISSRYRDAIDQKHKALRDICRKGDAISKKYFGDMYRFTYPDVIELASDKYDLDHQSAQHSDDSLQHYGVLGMRWGVRRYQNYDGTLTSAGKRHRKELVAVQSNSNMSVRDAKTKQIEQETKSEYNKNQPSENSLALAGVGLAYTTALVSAVAVDSVMRQAAISRDKKAEMRLAQDERDPKTDLPLKSNPYTTVEDDMKAVNPGRGSGESTSSYNCGYCTLAYDMRRRGYDVLAKKAIDGTSPYNLYKKYYKDAKVNSVEPEEFKDMFETYRTQPNLMKLDRNYRKCQRAIINQAKSEILAQGDGARGYFGVTWAWALSGHSMAYEVQGGKVNIIDSQAAKKKDISEYTSLISQCRYARLDNATPNYEQIRKDGVRA